MENDDDDTLNSNTTSLTTTTSDLAVGNCISLRTVLSRTKWMSKNSIEVLVLCSLLIFIATTIPNIQWSFAILFLQNHEASTLAISIYASCMSVFLLLTSLFSQKIKRLLPLKHMLIVCVLVLCGATCLHGTLVLLEDVRMMVLVGVVIRAVQGVSATMMQVLAVAILICRFPEKCGRVSAVNESALGLGYCLAPFLGGIVYDKVGFLLTFVIIGGCGFIMLGPLCLPCITSCKEFQHDGGEKEYSKIKWRDFLFLSPLITCTLSTICETCVDYVMALYVNDNYGEDATFSGLLLSGLSLSSLLFAFFLGYFCDKFNPFLLGVWGCMFTCIGFVGMVPPPFLHFLLPSKMGLAIAAVVTGLGQAMIWLHVLPSMLFVKVKCRERVVDIRLSNMVSLLYIVATSTGEIIGSYIAGGLLELCEYWQYFSVLATFMFSTLILCIILYCYSSNTLSRSFDSIPTPSNETETPTNQLYSSHVTQTSQSLTSPDVVETFSCDLMSVT